MSMSTSTSTSTFTSDGPRAVIPAPPGYTSFVNPEYIGNRVVAASAVCASLSTVFVVLRLYTRRLIMRSTGWDDLWIICALLNAIALTVATCLQTKYGAGNHLWDVTLDKFGTYLKIQTAIGSTYIFALAFAKISICCFYLRLSPARTFRTTVYAAMGFVTAYSIAGWLVVIFSCNPVAASWDLALAALPTTTCIDRPADYLAQAGLNIFSDVFILVLPVWTIWGLQLPTKQKISVISIFAVGLCVCIFSVIRLKSIIAGLNSRDVTWDSSYSIIWSNVEAHLCIICTCVAALKPLANHFFPRLLSKNSSNGGANGSAYPKIPGRGSKLANGSFATPPAAGFDGAGHGQGYAMQTYRVRAEAGEHRAVVRAGKDVDGSSQESIIGAADPFGDGLDKENGVYVTTVVQVS